ncbi:MAG: peptidylprolyl isomerase [Eubacteriales bacterium]|nr:peptidylprolyl isomerase [Eubacteriales bacterium]
MSASSKKKLRKEQESAKLTEQQLSARKEARKLNLYTIIFVAVMAVLLVVAVTVGVSKSIAGSGIREKKTTALTVADHKLSSVELNYFYMDVVNQFAQQYGSYAMFLGLDTTKPLDEQVQDPETGATWADNFLESAKEQAKAVYAMTDAAAAAGFTLSDEEIASVEANVSNMEAFAKLYGYADADAYLKAMYGPGSSKDSFLAYSKLLTLANAYHNSYATGLTYQDADLRAVDAEKPETYSTFSYNAYYLAASRFLEGGTTDDEGNTTYSDEEKAASVAAAEAAAKALTGEEIVDVATLDAAIAALDVNKDTEDAASTASETLYTSISDLYADWLADSSRKAGDVAYFASTSTDAEGNETVNGYQVVMFQSVNDNTFALPNVRHILVAFEGGTKDENTGVTTYTEEEKAAAKAEAEQVLSQWQSGDATEESFAALANEKSDDGNGTTGGLYENIVPGQMVVNFNDWCFESGRKAGDTGIVETEYGYHVMYFVGDSEYTYRDYMIENELRSADTQAWYNSIVDPVTVTEGSTKYIRRNLVLSQGQ